MERRVKRSHPTQFALRGSERGLSKTVRPAPDQTHFKFIKPAQQGKRVTEHQEKIKLWTDETGNYFPWVEELWALQAKLDPESIYRPVSEMALPKLSFLVNCIAAIRNRPELMSKIRDLAQRYPDPEQVRKARAANWPPS
jgi:hypothetical protein